MNREIRVWLTTNRYRRRTGGLTIYWLARWDVAGKQRGKVIGYQLPPPRNRHKPTMSRREAERLCRELERELNADPARALAGRSPTLGAYIALHLADRASRVRPRTLTNDRTALQALVSRFGAHRRLDSIHPAEIRAWRAALLETDRSAGTVRRYIIAASGLFRQALADGLCRLNPAAGLAGRNAGAADWRYVSVPEVDRLVAACRIPGEQTLLMLARHAALRRAEGLHLPWSAILWAAHRLRVAPTADWQPKRGRTRVVPIVPPLYAWLREHGPRLPRPQLVCGLDPATWASVTGFAALCRRAAVQRYPKPLHDLRKSCLTDWAQRFPIRDVAEWAGHGSNIETTAEYYLAVNEASYRAAAGLP